MENIVKKRVVSAIVLIVLMLIVPLFVRAEQELDSAQIIESIQAELGKINSLQTVLVHENFLAGPHVVSTIKMFYERPNKFRNEISMLSDRSKFPQKDTFICDGKILWQLNFLPENKMEKVIKHIIEKGSEQETEIIANMDPLKRFNQLFDQYEITKVDKIVDSDRNIYILNLEINIAYRKELEKMLNVGINPDGLQVLPEKIKYYWDIKKAYTLKTESYNIQDEMIDKIEYKEVDINNKIDKNLFLYSPPKGVLVKDMTEEIQPIPGKEGTQSSEFSLLDLKGKRYRSEQFEGKVVIIDFWAEWCPPCRKELPLIEALYGKLKNDSEIVLLTITMSSQQVISEFVKNQSYSFPVLIDVGGKVTQGFGAMAIPHVVVLDRMGVIAKVYQGYHEGIDGILEKDINELR